MAHLTESRACFAIEWYDSEAEANERAAQVREYGHTYNGGWSDGEPCGREAHRDYTDAEGRKWYAVTTA